MLCLDWNGVNVLGYHCIEFFIRMLTPMIFLKSLIIFNDFVDKANVIMAIPSDSALTRRHTSSSIVSPSRMALTSPSKHHTRANFQPLHLHPTTGRSVALNNDKSVATRHSAEYSNAYVFTERPLYLAEKVVIQVG